MVSRCSHEYGVVILLIAASAFVSCAAPEEPESLQKTSLGSESAAAIESRSSTRTFNFGGADLGDDDAKAALKSCVETGFFYDRSKTNADACTSYALAKLDCTDDGVKAAMSAGIRRAYENNLKNDDPTYGLAGFIVDQCVDCPTADANPVCASATAGNPGKRAGFLIMLLKQNGAHLQSRKQFIVKE